MKKNKVSSRSAEDIGNNLDRRGFITKTLLAGATLTTGSLAWSSGNAAIKRAAGRSTAFDSKGMRKLGSLEVSPIGLGCMSMTSGSYNPPRSAEDMVPVIRGAVDLGMTFLDTAEVYGPFTDEEIVGEAIKPIRNQVQLGSKLGFKFDNGQRAGRDARPESMRKALDGMLRRLQTDHIDLLYLHRVDPEVPIEDVAGTFSQLIKEGKALHYGLSEVSPETIRKAHAVHPVAAVQSEYSIIQRALENQVLDTCEELGIGFVPWGPVCRGFLADKFNEYSRFSEDSRFASVPYFTPEAINAHMEVLRLVRVWARKKDASPAQISLAWLLAQRPFIVPIPGTTKLHHARENMGTLQISFTENELAEFRNDLTKIELVGVRAPDSVLRDM